VSTFGSYIDIKTVHWAIENKHITDYNILVLKNTEDQVNYILRNLNLNVINKDLFISCYMSLKSLEKYNDLTHLLLYTNTIEDSILAQRYINDILSLNILSIPIHTLYNKALHSKNCSNLTTEINTFKNSSLGIISCVYIFGEGFDLPKLNGVCIAGNMQSETRIVQYILRPNRLEYGNTNKRAYVIIPYIDTDNYENENNSYEKVRHIISQMRNVDANIEQKISLYINTKKYSESDITITSTTEPVIDFLEENAIELNKLRLRLRFSKALSSKYSEEEDEYNYVRSINISLHIHSQLEYKETKGTYHYCIPFPEQYFKSKGVWKDWYDFLGIDTTKFIQSKQQWILFCQEKHITSLNDYYKACKQYDILPKEPGQFGKYIGFSNITNELGFNNKRRCKK